MYFKVYWLFNGSPIFRLGNNPHYQQTISNDTYTLTIYNVRFEDVGRYTLNVENSWGKATCTAALFVPPTTTRIGKEIKFCFYYLTNSLYSTYCTLMLIFIDSIHSLIILY
jgi:hypothetical protein